jgi:hypothetical protein
MKKTQGLVALLMLVFGTNIYAAEATDAAATTETAEIAPATENTDASSAGIGEQAQAPAATEGTDTTPVTTEAPATEVAANEEPKAEEATGSKKKKRKKSRNRRRGKKSSCTANSCYKSWPNHMEQALSSQNSFRSVQESCRAPMGQICTSKTVVNSCAPDCGTPASDCTPEC